MTREEVVQLLRDLAERMMEKAAESNDFADGYVNRECAGSLRYQGKAGAYRTAAAELRNEATQIEGRQETVQQEA